MIVVCGEALVDLVPAGVDPAVLRAHPGGSPANVAVGLARLEQPVALLARVSGDSFGRLLRGHLAGNGVDLDLAVAATEPTTLAVVALDSQGTAEYAFYVQGTADWQWTDRELPPSLPAGTQALVTGSLALALPPGGAVLETLVRRERAASTIVLDPNCRPELLGDRDAYVQRLETWVALAGIVKVSSEDLAWAYPDVGVDDVVRRWSQAGPALVVATLGGDGVLAVHGGREHRLAAEPVDVVDTVGAGDAFTAGLLDALARRDRLVPARLVGLTGDELGAVLQVALHVSAVTCTRAGADPPRRSELSPDG